MGMETTPATPAPAETCTAPGLDFVSRCGQPAVGKARGYTVCALHAQTYADAARRDRARMGAYRAQVARYTR